MIEASFNLDDLRDALAWLKACRHGDLAAMHVIAVDARPWMLVEALTWLHLALVLTAKDDPDDYLEVLQRRAHEMFPSEQP